MELSKQDLVRLAEANKTINEYISDCFDIKLEFSGRLGDVGFLSFTYVLLDIMGLPEDNTVRTNCCDIANSTGKWPDWGFCRDRWTDLVDDVSPGEFVTQVLDYVSKITPEEKKAYESAHLNHPASKD